MIKCQTVPCTRFLHKYTDIVIFIMLRLNCCNLITWFPTAAELALLNRHIDFHKFYCETIKCDM